MISEKIIAKNLTKKYIDRQGLIREGGTNSLTDSLWYLIYVESTTTL